MTDIDRAGSSSTSTARISTRWRGWPPAGWFLLVIASVVSAMCALVAVWMVFFGFSTTCRETPTMSDVRSGELALLVALAVGAVPWGLAVALARPRRRLVAAALVGLSPVLLALVVGLNPDSWRGSFCF